MNLNTDFRQPLQTLRRSARSFGRSRRSSRASRSMNRVLDTIDRFTPASENGGVRVREWMVPSSTSPSSSSLARTVGAGLAMTAGLVAYRQFVRPWHRTWGASEQEARRMLAGDDLVVRPTYTTTRAIAIEASAAAVWPVLLEFGHWRGHLYDDDDIASAFGIRGDGAESDEPPFQYLSREDVLGFGPAPWIGRWNRMRVVEMIPRRALVFGAMSEAIEAADDADPQLGTWAFILKPVNESMTRLLVRTRSRPSWALRPVVEAYDPVSFIAERNLLVQIRDAAESVQREIRTESTAPAATRG